jgi:hypothetical protein
MMQQALANLEVFATTLLELVREDSDLLVARMLVTEPLEPLTILHTITPSCGPFTTSRPLRRRATLKPGKQYGGLRRTPITPPF